MSKKRSVIFIITGVVLGALLTALLFLSVQRCESTPRQSPPVPTVDTGVADDTATSLSTRKFAVPEWDILSPNRNMSGNCKICGQILDLDSTPLQDATVRLRLLDEPWESANVEETALTDKDGKYCFNDLTAKAQYQLFAWAKKFAVASYEDAVCGAATDLYLEKGSTLVLKFVDEKGYSVPYVEVHLAGSTLWPSRRALSDERGRLTVHGLTEGMYSFGATKGNLSFSLLEPIELAAGDEVELEAQLTTMSPIQVTVKDAATKAPIVGAVVTAAPQSESLLTHTFISDKSGAITIVASSVAGTTVTVFAPGFAPKNVEHIHPGASIEVFLSRGSVIRGTVQTPKGSPIEGAQLNARLLQGETFGTIPNGNDRGFILKKAHAEQKGWPKALEIDDAACILGPTHIPLPSPKEGAPILTASDNLSTWHPTTALGEFKLDAIPAGEISLGATHPKYVIFRRPSVNIIPGQNMDGIPILMKLGATLSLRVVSTLGHPISESAVTIYDMDGQILKNADSGSDGYVEIEGLPEQFRVEAIAPLFIPGAKKMFGVSGQTVDAVIKLNDADQILRGRVVNRLGTGIAGATVEAELVAKGLTQVLTGESDSDGSFALESAGNGTYNVRARILGEIRATVSDASSRSPINLIVKRDQPDSHGVTNISPPPLVTRPSTRSMPPLTPPASIGGGDSLGVHRKSSRSTTMTAPPPNTISNRNLTEPSGNSNNSFVAGSGTSAYGQVDDFVVTGAPAGIGIVPIKLQNKGKKIVVARVQAGSMVAAAGVKAGAILLEVDSKKMTGVAMANNALQGPIGSVIQIDFLQNGEPLTVVVQRERK